MFYVFDFAMGRFDNAIVTAKLPSSLVMVDVEHVYLKKTIVS